MSRPKRLSLSVAGLAALGLAAGLATRTVAVPPQVPTTPDQLAPSVAPSTPAPTVLLMSDGRVIRGEVLETDDGYLVKTPIGKLPFPRRQVVGVFGSIHELYEYKEERPPRTTLTSG